MKNFVKYFFLLAVSLVYCILSIVYCSAQGTWTQKANLGGAARQGAVGFSIGTKGYIGTGSTGGVNCFQDFWEWDQATNTWTQKANFGGTAREYAVGFSIGTKGYIGTGVNFVNYSGDFWEWDQATNVWTKKTDFGGAPRRQAVGFSIGAKGYMGTGFSNSGITYTYYKDFWEWDQATDTWTQKADFGGSPRYAASGGFAIGNKGYIGTGWDTVSTPPGILGTTNDLWEWDQPTNTWSVKANFPGTARSEVVCFTVGNYAFLGTGQTDWGNACVSDFWKYDPSSNAWSSIPNFGGGVREFAAAFSIGCYGYVGTGMINDNYSSSTNDLWEYYDPANTTCGCNLIASANGNTTICAGATTTLSASGGTSYSWNTGNTSSSIVVSPTVTSNYSVVVSSGPSCSDSAYATVTVASPPIISASSNISICSGQGATLTVSGGWNYIWSNGVSASSIAVSPTVTTTYTVVAGAGTCSDTADASVTVGTLAATAASTPCSCAANNGTATVSATGGSLPYTYLWNTAPIQNTQTATGLGANNYMVTVTDAGGCSSMQTVTVAPTGGPTINTSTTPQTCAQGGTAAAAATGGSSPYTYLWSNGGTTSQISNLAAQIYSVTITDANGCSSTNTVSVASNGNIPVVTTTVTPACNGNNNGTATANVSGGIAPYNYSWSNGGTTSQISNLTSQIYTVTVTDAGGCSSTQVVTINQSSAITATASSIPACGTNNGTASVAAAGGSSPYTYLWSPTAAATATTTGLSTGIHTCTITDAAGCTQTATVNVVVNPNPTASAFNNVTITQGQSTTLSASGGTSYSWNNGSNGAVITVSPLVTTFYCVTVTDVNGCTDSSCVTVYIEQTDCLKAGELYIPNAFSPNGDGENDVLRLYHGNLLCIKKIKIIIYNRWGEKVFESSDSNFQWDGSFRGGTEESAVFTYYIKADLLNGGEINKRGNISLMR